MNFDVFDAIDFSEKELLLSNCKSAERNIMVSPYNALANARTGLEILCKGLIKKNNSVQIRGESGQPNLATMIDTCLRDGLFANSEAPALIRKHGNDTLHANKGSQKLHVVNTTNVQKAMEAVQGLYELLQEVFLDVKIPFDVNEIPFGFYEVVRAVKKSENEIIFGEYNYFVRDPQENYYYFQIFHRNSEVQRDNELGARGVLIGNKIKGDKGRRKYLLDVHYPSNLLAESDREYIAYSVYADSFLLSEAKGGQFTERQILLIALDLVNVLLELQSVGTGISLRNIQPGNVILTPNDDFYMAGIVNMETAKIHGAGVTVYNSMQTLVYENPYLPIEVRKGVDSGRILWDRVDVYSVAKLMMYCANPESVKPEMDEDDIYQYFSDEVAELLSDILGSSVNLIDDAYTFRENLQNALAEL